MNSTHATQNRVQNWVTLCLVLATQAACFHVTYTTGKPLGGIRVQERQSFFLGGLVGNPEIDVPALCKNGASKVDVWQTGMDTFLAFLTMGIYTPRSVQVWCAEDVSALHEIDTMHRTTQFTHNAARPTPHGSDP